MSQTFARKDLRTWKKQIREFELRHNKRNIPLRRDFNTHLRRLAGGGDSSSYPETNYVKYWIDEYFQDKNDAEEQKKMKDIFLKCTKKIMHTIAILEWKDNTQHIYDWAHLLARTLKHHKIVKELFVLPIENKNTNHLILKFRVDRGSGRNDIVEYTTTKEIHDLLDSWNVNKSLHKKAEKNDNQARDKWNQTMDFYRQKISEASTIPPNDLKDKTIIVFNDDIWKNPYTKGKKRKVIKFDTKRFKMGFGEFTAKHVVEFGKRNRKRESLLLLRTIEGTTENNGGQPFVVLS